MEGKRGGGGSGRNSGDGLAGLSLGAVLGDPKPASPTSDPASQTLLDVIVDKEPNGGGSAREDEIGSSKMVRRSSSGKKGSFRSDVDAEAVPDIIPSSRNNSLRRNSGRMPSFTARDEPLPPQSTRLSEALAAERQQIQRVVSSAEAMSMEREQIQRVISSSESPIIEDEEEAAERRDEKVVAEAPKGEEPVKMSLMDLLGEMEDDDDDDEGEEDEEEDEEEYSNVEHTCCVCMVWHKGSVPIPCGHTYCRLCSRELMVSKDYCHICNGFILEVLDIF